MATVAMMLGSAVVNALAFTGGNYLFSSLNKKHADEERKRHDLAIETLQKAQTEWSHKRTQRLDWINNELRRESHAVQTFQNVDDAIREYNLVTGKSIQKEEKEPVLSDFYTPSEDQKDSEIMFVIMGLGLTGFIVYKFI